MQARTIREGTVGLLAIFGLVLFGGLALWLRGIQFGDRSYEIVADFPNVNGIQVGNPVRYRGLKVGRITKIQPASNGVDVVMEIFSADLLIPSKTTIQASSSGLIGETFVDILPQQQLPSGALSMNPLARGCNSEQIICNNDRLQGTPGLTLDDLLPITYEFSKAYSDPEFLAKVNSLVQNSAQAAAEVTSLSRDVSTLVTNVQGEIGSFSNAAKAITKVADTTSQELISTAAKYQDTATKIDKLAQNVDELVTQNKTNLASTLNSISTTSNRLQNLVGTLDKTLATTDTEKLAQNLETLTVNAATAAENLKNVSATFSSPENLVVLQQTLDSARVTFANAQKITSDLEGITGDPAFLNNVKQLVDGLSNLVSSAQQLEQQVQTNKQIEPIQKLLLPTETSINSIAEFNLDVSDSYILGDRKNITELSKPNNNNYE